MSLATSRTSGGARASARYSEADRAMKRLNALLGRTMRYTRFDTNRPNVKRLYAERKKQAGEVERLYRRLSADERRAFRYKYNYRLGTNYGSIPR